MTFGKFTLRLAAFSALLAVILQLIFTNTSLLPKVLWWAFGYMVVITLIIYYISVFSLKMNVKNSMSLILGSMFFRLFSSLLFLIIYMVITGSRDIPYVVGFMCLYLLFQVFEIYHLLVNLRPDLKE
ncbi:MAG TPA: hypothetical protein DIW47_13830 [Bacteroidetes bacterium]|nr:hypothetical protein [Bacteroidota bacterium]